MWLSRLHLLKRRRRTGMAPLISNSTQTTHLQLNVTPVSIFFLIFQMKPIPGNAWINLIGQIQPPARSISPTPVLTGLPVALLTLPTVKEVPHSLVPTRPPPAAPTTMPVRIPYLSPLVPTARLPLRTSIARVLEIIAIIIVINCESPILRRRNLNQPQLCTGFDS